MTVVLDCRYFQTTPGSIVIGIYEDRDIGIYSADMSVSDYF